MEQLGRIKGGYGKARKRRLWLQKGGKEVQKRKEDVSDERQKLKEEKEKETEGRDIREG